MSRSSFARGLAVLGALALVAAAQYGQVRWTNFGGADEWLLLDLNTRGIFAMPHSNRPLNTLWSLPGPWLTPYRFEGYRLVYIAYLAASGWLTWRLARRLLPALPLAAFAAGAFAIGWAPLDMARLSVVQMLPNVAVTVCCLASLLLLVRFRDDGRPVWFAAAVLLAAAAARSYEAVLGLLFGAPLVVGLCRQGDGAGLRRPLRWLAAWEAAIAVLAAVAAWPFLRGEGGSLYQAAVVRADLGPLRYAARLGRQYAYHLAPLLPRDLSEVTLGVLPPVLAFVAGAALVLRHGAPAPADRRRLLLAAGLGLAMAAMGHSVLLLGASVTGPSRMQFLSAPGIAIFLSAAIGLVASLAPERARSLAALALATAVVAVGAGHTVGMQREWDRITFYPRQRDCLAALVREAPALRPGSLLLLIDEDGTWPFAFTFRHAARLVYGGAVTGHAIGSDQLLYRATMDAAGIRVSPWLVVQGPWRERPTDHRYDQVVVFRLSGGALSRLDAWPRPRLPALPEGARYAPAESITDGPAPASRRVLD